MQERLTERAESGEAIIKPQFLKNSSQRALDRLAEHEDAEEEREHAVKAAQRERDIFMDALNTYGIGAQLYMLAERCAELIQAVCKYEPRGATTSARP